MPKKYKFILSNVPLFAGVMLSIFGVGDILYKANFEKMGYINKKHTTAYMAVIAGVILAAIGEGLEAYYKS